MSYAMGPVETAMRAHYAGVRLRLTTVLPPPPAPVSRRPYLRLASQHVPQRRPSAVWPPYQEPAPYDYCSGAVTPDIVLAPPRRSVAEIIRAIGKIHRFAAAEIVGPRRDRDLVKVRHFAMWQVRVERPDLSLPQIGRAFNRDHTTILHGIRQHEKRSAAG